jgi:drug/metabolite transporter (DMT)-like permease
MNKGEILLGLLVAVISATLYGAAPVIQAVAARQQRPGGGFGLRLLLALALRPLWLLGLAVEAGSFLLEVYALSLAPVAFIAPVMSMDMVVFTILASRVLRERVGRAGLAGMGALVAGVGLLAGSFAGSNDLGEPASDWDLALFLMFGTVFAVGAGWWANRDGALGRVFRAAAFFGVAAGVSYAIATVATRQFGLYLDDHSLAHIFVTPTPYMLAVFSLLALSLEQRGLQGPGAVIVFPVTSGLSAFLPVILGLTLFDEPAPSGGKMAMFVVSLLLVGSGITTLGRSRAQAADPPAGDPGGGDPGGGDTVGDDESLPVLPADDRPTAMNRMS